MMEHLEHYPEILLDLRDKIAELIGDPEAAFAVTEHLRRERGGRNHYLRQGRKRKPAEPAPEQEGLFGPIREGEAAQVEEAPEWIAQLRLAAEQILLGRGLDGALAAAVAELVRAELTGEQAYIPQGQRYELARRDAAIFRCFRRSNIDAICRQHGISEQQVYAVLRRELRRRQGRLFG